MIAAALITQWRGRIADDSVGRRVGTRRRRGTAAPSDRLRLPVDHQGQDRSESVRWRPTGGSHLLAYETRRRHAADRRREEGDAKRLAPARSRRRMMLR
jgi:hypothetical protein